jgi:hypothetical protein
LFFKDWPFLLSCRGRGVGEESESGNGGPELSILVATQNINRAISQN